MNLKLTRNHGFILYNTLLFLIIFSMSLTTLITLEYSVKSQKQSIKVAKENAILEYEINQYVINHLEDLDQSFFFQYKNNNIEGTVEDDNVNIKVRGAIKYDVQLVVNLEKKQIKMYNYKAH